MVRIQHYSTLTACLLLMVVVNGEKSFFSGPEGNRNSVDDSGVVVEEDERRGQVEGVEVEELIEEDDDVEESVCRWRCRVKCLGRGRYNKIASRSFLSPGQSKRNYYPETIFVIKKEQYLSSTITLGATARLGRQIHYGFGLMHPLMDWPCWAPKLYQSNGGTSKTRFYKLPAAVKVFWGLQ